jgi:hypothetical protein
MTMGQAGRQNPLCLQPAFGAQAYALCLQLLDANAYSASLSSLTGWGIAPAIVEASTEVSYCLKLLLTKAYSANQPFYNFRKLKTVRWPIRPAYSF